MISYSIALAQPWHCGAIVRRLRGEQKAVAIGLNRSAHHELRVCYDHSGLVRSWVGSDRRVLAIMGVIGPLLASEGVVWLALTEDATHYPKQIIREARRVLHFIMTVKTKLYATPFVSDPASVRFAEHLGFTRTQEIPTLPGTVSMVLSVDPPRLN